MCLFKCGQTLLMYQIVFPMKRSSRRPNLATLLWGRERLNQALAHEIALLKEKLYRRLGIFPNHKDLPLKESKLHSDRSLENYFKVFTLRCLHTRLTFLKNKKTANSGFLTTFQIFHAWDTLAPWLTSWIKSSFRNVPICGYVCLPSHMAPSCPDLCLFLWWLLPPALQTACSHDFVTASMSQRLRLRSRNNKQYYTTCYFRGDFFFLSFTDDSNRGRKELRFR